MVWLNPKYISGDVATRNQCLEHLRSCLVMLEDDGLVSGYVVRERIQQFRNFAATEFKSFDHREDQLDVLYYDAMAGKEELKDLWAAVQMLLLLSHGQASVERGFSVNREAMVQNLGHKSLIAKRVIKDHVRHVCGVLHVNMTKELLQATKCAHQQYKAHLEDEKRSKRGQRIAQAKSISARGPRRSEGQAQEIGGERA